MRFLSTLLIASFFSACSVQAETFPVPEVKPDGEIVQMISEEADDLDDADLEQEEPPKPYDKPYVGDMIYYTTKYEDTLVNLSRDHNLGFVEVRAANPYVDPWLPGADVELVLPARHLLPDAPREGIVINLPEMRLFAFLDQYQPPVTHPLGIGREGLLTPIGTTTVVRKKEGPTWRPTPRMRKEDPDLPDEVPPGPENPLGTHALYLGWPLYALHGTNRPFGIGRRVSSGCIRLYPEDIKTFFNKVPVGTKVTVINQPIKAAWIDDAFYIEAHPTMEQADRMEEEGGLPSYEISKEDMRIIIEAAGEYEDGLDWKLVRKIVRQRRGYPVKIMEKPKPENGPDEST